MRQALRNASVDCNASKEEEVTKFMFINKYRAHVSGPLQLCMLTTKTASMAQRLKIDPLVHPTCLTDLIH